MSKIEWSNHETNEGLEGTQVKLYGVVKIDVVLWTCSVGIGKERRAGLEDNPKCT